MRTPRRVTIPAETLLRGQREVLDLVARNAPLADSLGAIARFAERHIEGMRASILYFDPFEKKLRRGGYGQLPPSFADIVDGLVPGPAMGSCGTSAWLRERVISEDVFTDPLWSGFHDLCRDYEIRSAWSSPLLSNQDGDLLGVFGMYHPEVRLPDEADLQIVDQFAHLATIATERFRNDQMQRHRAEHDALTGLRNRHGLAAEGQRLIDETVDRAAPISVGFLDLDGFKSFNDAFGHVEGDRLLQCVCAHLTTHLMAARLITRFGGDEFLVFLPEDALTAQKRLDSLRTSLAQGIDVAGQRVRVSFSAGLIEASATQRELDQLIFEADEATRESKALGGGRTVVVDQTRHRQLNRRRGLGKRLELALDAHRIDPHAQAIVRLGDGKVMGHELLFRTTDPDLASIPVNELIAEAESNGIIHRLGLQMLRAGIALLAGPGGLPPDQYVSVNVSMLQLLKGDFLSDVEGLLKEVGIDGSRICLELTESWELKTDSPARAAIDRLRQMGFRLAMDDFGTGYASLAQLQMLPFDVLKIDRQFVQRLGQGDRSRAFCVALVAMARACGMEVVAEGVETDEQARVLEEIGCDHGQGYLWTRPAPTRTLCTI